MEELDLLKKDWKKNENKFPRLSEKEIYAMLHKNSTSVVKWIFLVSVFEFAFFLAITLLLSDNTGTTKMERYLGSFTITALTVLDFGIMIYFFCLFYINYKKITATDQVKKLLSNIIKTRKTVSNYIFVKISYLVISTTVLFVILFNNEPEMVNARLLAEEQGATLVLYLTTFFFIALSVAFFTLIMWLFYRLIYGLLLKRLRKNYEELKKIDF